MFEHVIKCSNFCPYNKKLFCPFYVDNKDLPKNEFEKDSINLEKISNNKRDSIKPRAFKKKDSNGGDNGNNENDNYEWMTFSINITLNDFISITANGTMNDLQSGEFSGITLPNEEEDFLQINSNGTIESNNNNCDFGGNINLNLEIINKDKTTTFFSLHGSFESNYKSGGTLIETPETGDDNNMNKEEYLRKYYVGAVDFDNFKGTISFNTSM